VKSKSSFFNKGNNVCHLFLCLLTQGFSVNAFVFPANECDAQSFKLLSFGGGQIALYQSCLIDKWRNNVFEGTFFVFKTTDNQVKAPNFMFPAFHKSDESALSAPDSGFAVALADKPIRQKGDADAPGGGNESADKRGGYFFNELAQWTLLLFAALTGVCIAFFLAVPIGRAVCFMLDTSSRIFGRKSG